MNSNQRGLFSLSFALLLLFSLFVLPTKSLWASFDSWVFHACNSYVAHHPIQRIFWALANIKITDLFGALFFIGCFATYILEATGQERRKRSAQLLYTLLWFEISILLTKQLLIGPLINALSLWRKGPTLLFPDTSYFLSRLVFWHKTKDCSHSCFPGDHAIIIFHWCALFYYFAGKKWGIPTALFGIFFLFPRLISGAHWASDLLVGSLSIVTFFLFVATSPFVMERIMALFYRFVGYEYETEPLRFPLPSFHIPVAPQSVVETGSWSRTTYPYTARCLQTLEESQEKMVTLHTFEKSMLADGLMLEANEHLQSRGVKILK